MQHFTPKNRLVILFVVILAMVLPGAALAQPPPLTPEEQGTLTDADAAAAAATEESSPEAVMTEVIRQASEDWHVSLEEAEERLNRQDNVAALIDDAVVSYPDTFAGVWVDNDNGGTVMVAMTDDAEGVATSLGAEYGLSEVVQPVTAEASLAELESVFDAASDSLADIDADTTNSVSLDIPNNQVVLSGTGVVQNEVLDDLPAVGIDLVETAPPGPPIVDDACTRASCTPTLRGGLQITRSGSFCSSGFNARNAAGTRYLLTAGHCGAAGTVWSHGGSRIGGTPASQDTGDVDAARILIENSSIFGQSRWVYHTNTAQAFSITARSTVAGANVGRYVCRSAYNTGLACGEITANSSSVGTGAAGNTNFFSYEACATGGDSGGAVYDPNGGAGVAIGLHTNSTTGDCVGTEVSYGPHIRNVEAAMDVTVVTN